MTFIISYCIQNRTVCMQNIIVTFSHSLLNQQSDGLWNGLPKFSSWYKNQIRSVSGTSLPLIQWALGNVSPEHEADHNSEHQVIRYSDHFTKEILWIQQQVCSAPSFKKKWSNLQCCLLCIQAPKQFSKFLWLLFIRKCSYSIYHHKKKLPFCSKTYVTLHKSLQFRNS
jgi:hypothetical protein